MLATAAEASRALDDPDLQHKYLTLARRAAEFLLDALGPGIKLRRSWRLRQATAYICEGFVCKMPVNTISDLQRLL